MERAGQVTRRASGKRHKHFPILAALDLGTNNCRLLVAEPTRRGDLRVVDSFSRIVRLGEGVTQNGALSQAAMDRTLAVLRICAQRLKSRGLYRLRAIATAACRSASNAEEFVTRVALETGIELSVISVEEEARLAALGCAPLIDAKAKGAMIFDIGGGSTEIIWMRRQGDGQLQIAALASEPVGVVVLSELWGGSQSSDRAIYSQMLVELERRFRSVKTMMNSIDTFESADHHLLGTSGTVTTLAGVALGLSKYNRARVDTSWHDCAALAPVVDRLIDCDKDARAAIGCVGRDRADLIVPGCAIYTALQVQWPCERLRVADRGLREGILRDLMSELRS